mmetsp:Transcript_6957/g.21621  ORF Transcript_6957/g.21621 Transcript_6957/m.21621 type:complete len:337 (-) Transcript_6957:503-1513(-)
MRAPRLKPAPPEAAQRTQRSLQGEDDARGAASLRQHVHLLPLVQHDLLAAEERLAPHLAVRGVCGAHELHDPLLDVQLGDLPLAQGVHGDKLPNVVAGHCERGCVRVEVQEQRRQHLQSSEVILLELQDVLRPKLCGVDEAPREGACLQLPLVPLKIAHLVHLGGNLRGHVTNVVVELRIAPLLKLQLLHCLEDALLHDLLAERPVREEVPQDSETEPHDLLRAGDSEDLLELLDGGVALELRRDLGVEGEHPDGKDAAILEGRGVRARLDLEDALSDTWRAPDESAEDVRLQEVGDRLEDTELCAEFVFGFQHLLQQAHDIILPEEPWRLANDCG